MLNAQHSVIRIKILLLLIFEREFILLFESRKIWNFRKEVQPKKKKKKKIASNSLFRVKFRIFLLWTNIRRSVWLFQWLLESINQTQRSNQKFALNTLKYLKSQLRHVYGMLLNMISIFIQIFTWNSYPYKYFSLFVHNSSHFIRMLIKNIYSYRYLQILNEFYGYYYYLDVIKLLIFMIYVIKLFKN